jgi:hypothetical protein
MFFADAPRGAAQAITFPTLYDNFDSALIDPGRWEPPRVTASYETLIHQVPAPTMHRRLLIRTQGYGDVGTSGAISGPRARVFLPMKHGIDATKTGIQATLDVHSYTITGCGSLDPSRVAARLYAVFFRDGANPNPSNTNDFTGIVETIIQLQAFPGMQDTLTVSFFADRCGDAGCSDALLTDLGFGRFQNVSVGQDVTLGIEWDRLSHRFIFTKNNETLQTLNYPPTYAPNTDPTQTNLPKAMLVRARLETCPTRTTASMTVTYDNFRVMP